MRPDDIYFKIGDKVMRVNPNHAYGEVKCAHGYPVMGQVYCVSDFWEGPTFNVVMLVGFGGFTIAPNGYYPMGWRATYFRKVEEIRLCLNAVKHSQNLIDVKDSAKKRVDCA